MIRVAVTGASGFIGRATVETLAASGCEVRACVRDPLAFAGLALPAREMVAFGGAADAVRCVQGVDVVLHVAGRAHVNPRDDAAAQALMRRTNVDDTEALARAARDAGVRRFVFVSSIGVHGTSSGEHAFTPEDTPAPVDFYAHTKWEAEQRLRALGGAMEVVVVRPTLVAGAGAPGNLARLAGLLMRGVPIPVVTGGAQRHLVGVRSLARLLELACTHRAAAGRLLLAADDPPLSAAEMARAIAAGIGVRARILSLPMGLLRPAATLLGRGRDLARIGSPLRVDAAATRAALSWRAPVPIHEELEALGRAVRSASGNRRH